MNLRPLEDRVIVTQAKAEEQTKSGLFIPDSAQEKPQRGTVVAVGPGKMNEAGKRVAVDLKVGDTVIYGKYGGTDIKLDDQEYKILESRDVYAVVED
jgi:chaperonin GroES